MSPMEVVQREEFLRGLDIIEPKEELRGLRLRAAPPVDDVPAGYVDGGSLVCFVEGVPALQKQDVLNSCLLAQLAADKKHDREQETRAWYDFYRTVLGNIGWVIQDFQFQEFHPVGATFTIHEAVIKILTAIATQNQLAVITATLESFKSLTEDDKRFVLFDHKSKSRKGGSFQISSVDCSEDVPVMRIGGFQLQTTQTSTRFLFFNFSATETKIYHGSQSINLNSQVYSAVRQQIVEKLGDNAKNFLADLELDI